MFAGNRYYEFMKICAVFLLLTIFISLICIGAAFLVTLGLVIIRFYYGFQSHNPGVSALYLSFDMVKFFDPLSQLRQINIYLGNLISQTIDLVN